MYIYRYLIEEYGINWYIYKNVMHLCTGIVLREAPSYADIDPFYTFFVCNYIHDCS